jgi:adenylate cyclase
MAVTRRLAGPAVVAAMALVLVLWRFGVGDPLTNALEDRLHDLRMHLRGPLPAPESVALVTIDEASVAAIGMGAPMRRAVARAVDALREEGAVAIGIDLLLVERTVADAQLAASLSRMPGAILAIASLHDARPPSSAPDLHRALALSAFRTVVRSRRPAAPTQPMVVPNADLSSAAVLGHVNLLRDPDRVARHMPLALAVGDGLMMPALPLTAARLSLGLPAQALHYEVGQRVLLGERIIETDGRGAVAIVHRGPAGLVDRVPLLALLDGALPEGGVEGRVVLIGATAESLGDIGATPFGADVAGVETLAAVTAQLIEGRAIRTGSATVAPTIGLAVGGAVLAWMAALIPAALPAVLASAAVWLGVLLATALAFITGSLMVDATAVLGGTALATAASWTFGRFQDQRKAAETLRQKARLEPHVTPLLDRLEDADGSAPMAVVFADMIGSTAQASGQDADTTARTIAAVHARIATVTERHGGLVAEVLGDGALLVFGPEPDAGTAARSAMVAVEELAAGTPTMRVTAHFGQVALAELGTAKRRHITLAGDTVNVAARLQDEARRRGTHVMVSQALVTAAGAACGLFRAEPAILRGRSEAVAVFTPPP